MNYSKLHPDFFQGGGYSPVQISNSEFIPTYAGAPLAEAQRNAEQTASIYHQNIADLTKIDIMNANRKVNPSVGDQTENEKINARLAEQFKNIASKGDFENQTMQVNALLREYMNDPAVKTLTESRANADKEKEFQQAAKAKGARIVLANPPEEHQSITYDENGKPQYNVYQGTGQIRLGWEERKAQLADNLKGDMSTLTGAELDAAVPGLRGYLKTGSVEALTGGVDKNGTPIGKVGRLLNDLVTTYKGTAEYEQEKASLMQDENLTDEDAERLIRTRLFSEGMLRTYSKVNADYHTDWILQKALDKPAAPPTPWATGATAAVTNPLIDPVAGLLGQVDETTGQVPLSNDVTLEKDGVTLSPEKSNSLFRDAAMSSGIEDTRLPETILEEQGYKVTKKTRESVAAQNKELDKLYTDTVNTIAKLDYLNFDEAAAKSIKEMYPNWINMSPEGKRKAWLQIQKESVAHKANITTPELLQTQEQVIDEGKMLNYVNNIADMSGNEIALAVPKELYGGSYKDLNGWNGEHGVQGALKKIAKANGLNTEKKLTYTGSKQGTSVGNPYGIPGASNTVITVRDEDGNTISVPMMAAPNKQLQGLMKPLNDVFMVANNGKFGEEKVKWPGFGEEGLIVEKYPTHENGIWESKARVKLPAKAAKIANREYIDIDDFQNIWYLMDKDMIDLYKNTFIR